MRYLQTLVVLVVALAKPVVAEWKVVKLIEAPSVMSFDVNKDGSLVAYTTPARRDIFKEDGTVAKVGEGPPPGDHLYNVKKEQGILLVDRSGNLRHIWGLAFSPLNDQLVSIGSAFGFWANNGRLLRSLERSGSGQLIRPKQGGHFLELKGQDPTLWSFSGSYKTGFTNGNGKQVAWSNDGKHIVAAGKTSFTKWSVAGKPEHVVPIEPYGEPIGIACSEDGEEAVIVFTSGFIVTISGNGPAKLFTSFSEIVSIRNCSLAMSDDGKAFALAVNLNQLKEGSTLSTTINHEISLWQDRIPKVLTGHTSTVTKVMFLNDTTLVSADEGGVIGIWDLKSEETKVEFITGKGPAEDIKISGDNRTIAVLQKGSGILVLKTDAKKEPPVLKPKKATKKEVAGGKK